MGPPLPDQCDKCSSRLPSPPLVCGRCKAYAYCAKECQAADWEHHRGLCSSLPAGELVPTTVQFSQERADEVNRLNSWLLQVAIELARARGPGDYFARVGAYAYLAKDKSSAFKKLLTYQVPPALAAPPIPTRPLSTAHRKQKLVLAHITRLYLLHDLSQATPTQAQALFSPARLAEFRGGEIVGRGSTTTGPLLARIHGAKVLAVPDRLSVDEYTAVSRFLGWKPQSSAKAGVELYERWRALVLGWQVMVAVADQSEKRGEGDQGEEEEEEEEVL